MAIYFYSVLKPYGEFSNFSSHAIVIDGQRWPTTEHYFQAQKFDDTAYREKIRSASTPKRAAELGRSRSMPLRANWESEKDEVMYRAVRAKFEPHAELRTLLISTGTEEIIENAPGDYYWGCGKDGSGRNMLGQILVRVREELK